MNNCKECIQASITASLCHNRIQKSRLGGGNVPRHRKIFVRVRLRAVDWKSLVVAPFVVLKMTISQWGRPLCSVPARRRGALRSRCRLPCRLGRCALWCPVAGCRTWHRREAPRFIGRLAAPSRVPLATPPQKADDAAEIERG